MIRFLFDWILSIFFFRDITLILNGSKVTFSKEGDIILHPQRSFISNSKYNFFTCSPTQIEKIMNSHNLDKDIENLADPYLDTEKEEDTNVCCH